MSHSISSLAVSATYRGTGSLRIHEARNKSTGGQPTVMMIGQAATSPQPPPAPVVKGQTAVRFINRTRTRASVSLYRSARVGVWVPDRFAVVPNATVRRTLGTNSSNSFGPVSHVADLSVNGRTYRINLTRSGDVVMNANGVSYGGVAVQPSFASATPQPFPQPQGQGRVTVNFVNRTQAKVAATILRSSTVGVYVPEPFKILPYGTIRKSFSSPPSRTYDPRGMSHSFEFRTNGHTYRMDLKEAGNVVFDANGASFNGVALGGSQQQTPQSAAGPFKVTVINFTNGPITARQNNATGILTYNFSAGQQSTLSVGGGTQISIQRNGKRHPINVTANGTVNIVPEGVSYNGQPVLSQQSATGGGNQHGNRPPIHSHSQPFTIEIVNLTNANVVFRQHTSINTRTYNLAAKFGRKIRVHDKALSDKQIEVDLNSQTYPIKVNANGRVTIQPTGVTFNGVQVLARTQKTATGYIEIERKEPEVIAVPR